MQSSEYLFSRFTILFLLSFYFILLSSAAAQVKIKEKVEIKPKAVNIEINNDSLNINTKLKKGKGYNGITSGTGSSVIISALASVKVTIEGSEAAAQSDLVLRSPVNETIIENANQKIGEEWNSDLYPAQTIFTFGLNWSYEGNSGTEAGAIIDTLSSRKFRISFEDIGVYDYNDLVILVEIIYDHNMEVKFYPDEILAGEESEIILDIKDRNGNVESFPEGELFNARLTKTDDYGSVLQTIDGSITSDELTGVTEGFKFISAEDLDTTNLTTIQLNVDTHNSTYGDLDAMDEITIYKSDIAVLFSKNELTEGDTSIISLYKINENGNLENFPADQKFDISIIDGKDFGMIENNNGEKNIHFEDEEQPFMLIVGDSISGSKKEIRIKASTFVEEGNTVEGKVESKHPIQIVGSSKSQNSTNKNVTNADNSVKKNNSITFINPGGSFAEKIFGIGKATVGNNVIVQFEPAELTPGDTALVKIYKKDANGELIPYPAGQKFEVGILDGCDYGDLLVNNTRGTYFTNIEEPIKYIAEDNISVDSAKVSLRVGIVQTANQSATFMQPIAAGANYSKKRRVKTAASSGKNINKLTATSCSLEPFVYDEYGIGSVIFKKIGRASCRERV